MEGYGMGYREALVFFIDILGSQGRNDFQELLDINETFHRELTQNQVNDSYHTYTVYKRKIFTFSDCAYIIYDFKDGVEDYRKDLRQLFDIALRNTEPLLVQFLKKGFLCRGGIAYGDVYYETERSLFFGPAINRAHYYEERIAKYPRIIMDEKIATEVMALNCERIKNSISPEIARLNESMGGQIVLKDQDGQYYLNYLNTLSQGTNYTDWMAICDLWSNLLPREVSEQDKKIVNLLEQLNRCNDEEDRKQLQHKIEKCYGIIEKYTWLKNYLYNSQPEEDKFSEALSAYLQSNLFLEE